MFKDPLESNSVWPLNIPSYFVSYGVVSLIQNVLQNWCQVGVADSVVLHQGEQLVEVNGAVVVHVSARDQLLQLTLR